MEMEIYKPFCDADDDDGGGDDDDVAQAYMSRES